MALGARYLVYIIELYVSKIEKYAEKLKAFTSHHTKIQHMFAYENIRHCWD